MFLQNFFLKKVQFLKKKGFEPYIFYLFFVVLSAKNKVKFFYKSFFLHDFFTDF